MLVQRLLRLFQRACGSTADLLRHLQPSGPLEGESRRRDLDVPRGELSAVPRRDGPFSSRLIEIPSGID